MSVAYKYNPCYSVADYQQWEGDWELIDGVAVSMTPSAFGEHQQLGVRLTSLIFNQLAAAECDHCFVYYELDWIVDQHTVLRPDLMVVCGERVEKFLERAPQLVVEILSRSTEEKDRSVKFEIYQQQQVAYYLIADPVTQSLEFYQLTSGKYQRLSSDHAPYKLQLHNHCQIQLNERVS